MPRSPLTEKINRVGEMVLYVRDKLSRDEYDLFLDMVAPEPQLEGVTEKPAANSQPVKKRKVEKCDACNWTKRAAVHKDPTADGYHEFQSSKAGNASEKSGVRRGRKKADANDGEGESPVLSGQCSECGDAQSSLLHDKSAGYGGYHEFKSAA